MISKEYTVKELKEVLDQFKDSDIVIVRGTSNGTFSHAIDDIGYGKNKNTEGKVCIYGRRW